MLEGSNSKENKTLMAHFLMHAPPSGVPTDVLSRTSNENLYISPVHPNYDQILAELEKIGDNWHLRDEHLNPKRREKTRQKLEGENTSAWHFMRGDLAIGFCVAVKGGFNGELERIAERNQLEGDDGAEIYKVGLYPEYTNQAYGHSYLPLVQAALLNGQQPEDESFVISPSDFIYLNTRPDVNHVDSRNFYIQLGYQDAGEESWTIPQEEFKHVVARKQGRAFVPRSASSNDNSSALGEPKNNALA